VAAVRWDAEDSGDDPAAPVGAGGLVGAPTGGLDDGEHLARLVVGAEQ
jgi:hypothetical protein